METNASNRNKTNSEIPTAALPDIIFMLLFFFMVTTTLRETEKNIQYKIPPAEEIKKIERDDLVQIIEVGFPIETKYGTEVVIKVNGRIVDLFQLPALVLEFRSSLPEYQKEMMMLMLKVDEHVKMGQVLDIQQQLRKINALKIIYATDPKFPV